ncbi:MAG: ABC transporter ATP-binding protein [Rhodocyclaceae bacterium]
MPSDDIVISARNLSKSYRLFGHPGDRVKQFLSLGLRKYHREFTALQDVSFDIRRGETIGIIGRNGSGKSTLLQLVCGILKPSSGSIAVNGRVSALLELGAGFNPEFTGRENVYFQGMIHGFSRQDMGRHFNEIECFADIGEFIDQPVRTYSSGMFVRLAFAVAVHVAPQILIVDEALSVGDFLFQAKCFEKFRSFKQEGVTILFVTHSLDLVTAHCDRAILIEKGGLVVSGSPNEAINAYRRLLTSSSRLVPHEAVLTNDLPLRAWDSTFSTNQNETRYGSKETEIIEAGLFTTEGQPTQLFRTGEICQIKVRLLANRDNLDPFVSFVIKDLKGTALLGTNTNLEGFLLKTTRSSSITTIVFRLPMLLNPGRYLLSVGSQVLAADGSPVAHDHRSDYMTFEVIGNPRHGIFAPPIEIAQDKGV